MTSLLSNAPSTANVPFWLASALLTGSIQLLASDSPTPEQLDFFEKKIRPVLVDKCYKCHSSDAKSLKGGLLLDSRDGWIKGGETGPALVPGHPEKSLGITAIRYTDDEMLMPPKKSGGQLPAEIVADFESWVKQGAPWPEEKKSTKAVAKFDLQERKNQHWCWKPPVASKPPQVQNGSWSKTPADQFILAKLEANNLKPAPSADRTALLRRLSFDIIGLPPTPEETTSFLNDKSPNALEKVVDRLLASPHYGERWARHWMDLVRYAEGRGHEFDPPIANAWQYRDYLIRTLNTDIPYPEFVKEHIAGDLIKPRINPATGGNESILGTGFWFLGEEVHSPVDIRQDEADRMDNRLDVMTKSFLGLTVTCARCHDHKFDAISQKDYYALTGFLLSSSNRQVRFESIETEAKIAAQLDSLISTAQPSILSAFADAERPGIQTAKTYLLAARDCFLNSADARGTEEDACTKATIAFAEKMQLDPKTLLLWLTELKSAKTTPTHPLHLFASSALVSESLDSAQLTGRIDATLERFTKPPLAPSPESHITVIADYTKPDATPWLQDGFAFGLRPTPAGQLKFSDKSDPATAEIVTRTSARRQTLWKTIQPVGEPEAGTLKEYTRSGQTLRTPEVTLEHGQLWYLVKGAGRAYAVVDSHIMIQGPLHGKLLTKWKNTNSWEWVSHNLTDYKGHRAHIELLPEGAEDIEIAMVVECSSKPAMPFQDYPSQLTVSADQAAVTAEALATGAQRVMEKTAQQMRLNMLAKTPELTAWAAWMVQHLDLFSSASSPERRILEKSWSTWVEQQNAIAKTFPAKSQTAPAMFEGTGVDEFLLRRGSARSPMAPVPRRFLEALSEGEGMAIKQGSGRLELAEKIISAQNPLTARVLVNRVWHHLFGRGIVATVDNFGVLGQLPSHPELLDYLALRFMHEQKWSVKSLIRELVLSSTYQMSSKPADKAAEESDPQNLLLHRANLRRIEGEIIRDSVLAVSGSLNPKQGGASIPVFITPFMEGRGKPASGPLDGAGRRSVYLSIKRNFLSPMMLAFDMPIPFSPVGRRNVSNVPAQSLVMMNDPFIVAQATKWAESLPPNASAEERVHSLYIRAFARPPLPDELRESLAFVREQSNALNSNPNQQLSVKAWADLCHVLFNTKEFIHLN